MVDKVRKKYPFGEWEEVAKCGEVAYTGRQIGVAGKCIHLSQKDFVNGRTEQVPVKRTKGRANDSSGTPAEHAEFRSGVGDLHWLTS